MARIEKTQTVTNDVTGEVLSRTSNVIELNPMPEEPAFIKLYIDDLGRLYGLPPTSRNVLLYVAASMSYDGIASMTPRRKASIAMTLKTTVAVVDNALSDCVKRGLMTRVARGEYLPNPIMFARGKWAEIRAQRASFAATFAYGEDGRQIIETRKLNPDEVIRLKLDSLAREQLKLEQARKQGAKRKADGADASDLPDQTSDADAPGLPDSPL